MPPLNPKSFSITGIEFIQSVQKSDNSVPLIGNKTTYARVLAKTQILHNQVRGRLRVLENGKVIKELSPVENIVTLTSSGSRRTVWTDTLNFLLDDDMTMPGDRAFIFTLFEEGEQADWNNTQHTKTVVTTFLRRIDMWVYGLVWKPLDNDDNSGAINNANEAGVVGQAAPWSDFEGHRVVVENMFPVSNFKVLPLPHVGAQALDPQPFSNFTNSLEWCLTAMGTLTPDDTIYILDNWYFQGLHGETNYGVISRGQNGRGPTIIGSVMAHEIYHTLSGVHTWEDPSYPNADGWVEFDDIILDITSGAPRLLFNNSAANPAETLYDVMSYNTSNLRNWASSYNYKKMLSYILAKFPNGNIVTPVITRPQMGRSFIQSTYRHTRNFDILVPEDNYLQHYWRDNDTWGFPWHAGVKITMDNSSVGASSGNVPIAKSFSGACFLETNFRGPGIFEVIYKTSPVLGTGGHGLGYGYFDPKTGRWNGHFDMHLNIDPIVGVTGDPSFIHGSYGINGNFEMLVPQGNRLQHYWRDNDKPGFPWHKGITITLPNHTGGSADSVVFSRSFTGVCLIQSRAGNLEFIYKTSPVFGTGEDRIGFGYCDKATGKWSSLAEITVEGKGISGITGNPAFIQSNFGINGNFEMLVPQGNRLQHYWRDNDGPGQPWKKGGAIVLGSGRLDEMPGKFTGVSLLQSNFGNPNNLEFVFKTSASFSQTDSLGIGYYDAATGRWNGPYPLVADNALVIEPKETD